MASSLAGLVTTPRYTQSRGARMRNRKVACLPNKTPSAVHCLAASRKAGAGNGTTKR